MKYLDKEHIIYVDNHLLVVDKPADVVTQPDFVELAREWVKRTYAKPGAVFLHPAHRLDKPVCGLVLFARSSKALSRLNAMMRDGNIEKRYLATVEGSLPQLEGEVVHFLTHGSFRAHIVQEGKQAILHYKVVGKEPGRTTLQIDLKTGRYHQIRAQLSALGCPIFGDKKYGSTKTWHRGIALHHTELKFQHPVTRKLLALQSCFTIESSDPLLPQNRLHRRGH